MINQAPMVTGPMVTAGVQPATRGARRLLWLLAGLAIASLAALPVEQLLPARAAVMPVALLRLAAMVQPALLVALALWLGGRFAPRLGLGQDVGLPMLAAAAARQPVWPQLRARLPAIMAAALFTAGLLLLWNQRIVPTLGLDDTALGRFSPPLVTRLLYGGIGEEVMMRWGVLTGLAGLALRLGLPRGPALALAALLSALAFGAGHLPLLGLLASHPGTAAMVAVVLANALPGLVFAGLFINCGLEAAMLAHGGAHLIFWLVG